MTRPAPRLLAALLAVAAPLAAAVPAGAADRSSAAGRGDLRAKLGATAVVTADARTGGARAVARLDGFLTGPSARGAADVVFDYARQHDDVFALDAGDLGGLELARRYRSGGMEHLVWAQTYRGVPSADTSLRASVTASGRLINVLGPAAPDLSVPSIEPRIGPRAAFAAVAPGPAPAVAATKAGPQRETSLGEDGRASLAIYRSRLAWRVLAFVDSRTVYDAIVDAASGEVLRRVNRVQSASTASAFDYFPGAPAGGTQVTRDITPYLPANPTKLQGDNTHTGSDFDDEIRPINNNPGSWPLTFPAGDEVAPSAGTDWLHPFLPFADPGGDCNAAGCSWDPTTANSWRDNREQDATQVFYFVNHFHDHLKAAPIGFTEASGNFEEDNGGQGGQSGDAILAQVMDGANTASGRPDSFHINNANMLTLDDGFPGMMQMYLFSPAGSPFGAYSGGDDASVVYHEYTHGLSNRLVTDADGFGALNSAQSGAMGEGWSDWYAMDLLVEEGFQPDTAAAGEVQVGAYVDNGSHAIRSMGLDCLRGQPSTDCPGFGGYGYEDFAQIAGGPEVHADGEIWGQTLWQLRQRLIDAHGASDGLTRVRRYVTDGMRLSPEEPSFLDMRNAILQAAVSDLDDQNLIWEVFAARGMGFLAASVNGDDTTPTEDFSLPPTPLATTGEAVGIGPTSATLRGTINPRGGPTSWFFDYGTTEAYGSRAPATPASAGSGSVATAVQQAVGDLESGTVHHYRVVARRGTNNVAGADRTFTTAPAPPATTPGTPPPVAPIVEPRFFGAAIISARRITVDRRGRFRVRLNFLDDAPRGTAKLGAFRGSRRIGSGSVRSVPGNSLRVRITLTKAGLRSLRRASRGLKVTLRLTLRGASPAPKSVTLRLTRR